MFNTETAKMVLTAAYRLKATGHLKENDIVSILSMEKEWLTPGEARKFLENAKKAGLLGTKDGTLLSPTFDMKEIKVPLNFSPNKEELLSDEGIEAPPEVPTPEVERPEVEKVEETLSYSELLQRIIKDMHEKLGIEKKEIIKEMKDLSGQLLVDSIVALILVAAMKGMDISPYIDAAEKVILEG